MKRKTLLACCLSMILISAVTQAKDLVVSDIDDTLKISHVNSVIDSVQNALVTNRPFLGMSTLLSTIKNKNPDLELVYLSNAPSSLLESSHRTFLSENKFPEGEVRLRMRESAATHKIVQLRQLIQMYRPQKMLLIGDNGEKDPVIYEQIQKEFPNIEMTILIHQVGSFSGQSIKMGQVGFVTSIDAALSLTTKSVNPATLGTWLELSDLSFLNDEIESFLAEPDEVGDVGSAYIPDWMNCTDYKQSFNVPFDMMIELFIARLPLRCAHVSSELVR